MRLLFCSVIAMLVLAIVGGPARADNREDARKEFAAGQQADKNKDYLTAIEHYQRAYDLVPHHFALYNIATAYERLGQLRESARWFERYLDEAPQSLQKERREVERLVLELKLRPAKLTVQTSPPGARVVIDGQPAGVSPFTRAIRGGGHRVRVELEGEREERDVFLEYAEPQTIEVTLKVKAPATTTERPKDPYTAPVVLDAPSQTKTSGLLVLRGGPTGAFVAIDDRVIGRLPGEFHLERGQHKLNITMYGHQPYDNNVMIMTGGRTELEVNLQAGGATASVPTEQAIFGYYVGAALGLDVRGSGAQFMGELGYRIITVDIAARFGRGNGRLLVDVLLRWSILRTKLSPFVQAGYAVQGAETSGDDAARGFLFGGGLRYDLARGPTSVSALVESGVRYVSGTSSATMMEETAVFIPFLASVQMTFGARTARR